jgi:hypothetical protein
VVALVLAQQVVAYIYYNGMNSSFAVQLNLVIWDLELEGNVWH